ncbi:hypothetical protein G3567_09660 [Psychroflexus sp. YR1-1]|uniref:Uncharacterized protein n=2 Tax=Psychroflexus aurantiacus TaxID=2709310 RepID=A0A6B3R2Z9_9FLAO|nr:hypothetical protein [Psychroflexus aurantiacus]
MSFTCFGQSKTRLQSQYDQIFHIKKEKYPQGEYLRKMVNSLEEDHEFEDLVNNNKLYLDYLLTNFSTGDNYQELLALKKNKALQEKFINALEADSLFNSAMFKLSEKASNPSFVQDTVSMDELLNVAVKFFNIKGITKEGHYAGKVCSGINAIVETLPKRKPHLEAFSFSTILQNIKHQDENMQDEFIAAIYELYKLDLGVEKEDRLLRAQGVMFSLMRNNAKLKQLLLSEYEKKKEYLPFVISHG